MVGGIGGLRLVLLASVSLLIFATSAAVGGSVTGVATSVFSAAFPLIPLSLGAAVVISAGEIDLSVAGAISMYGTLILLMSTAGLSPALALPSSLCLACAVGFLIGCLVVRFRVPSLVATLGVGMVCAGVALLFDGIVGRRAATAIAGGDVAHAVRTVPQAYQLGLFQLTGLWAGAAGATAIGWRYFTLSALRHLAVGMNRNAASLAALPVNRIRFQSFVGSSLLAWLTAMLLMIGFQGGGWNPGSGRGLELIAIVIAVLGGTRITGGWFDPIGLMVASVLWVSLSQLQYVVPGLGPETQLLFTGTMVVLVAIAQSRKAARNE
jgi:ribose transport system permease protein